MSRDEHDPVPPEGPPESVRTALREAFRPTATERAELDARVRTDAARWFAGAGPQAAQAPDAAQLAPASKPRTSPWVWRAAAALVLTLGGWIAVRGWMRLDQPAPTGQDAPLARGPDVDGSGRVDVLDALHVARALAQGGARPEWDFNADGRVDRADADELAQRAVRIRS